MKILSTGLQLFQAYRRRDGQRFSSAINRNAKAPTNKNTTLTTPLLPQMSYS